MKSGMNVGSMRFMMSWSRLKGLASSPIVHGSALLSIAEVGNRLSRIVTAVVLARCLSPLQFGTIALVLAIFELVRMFIHNGIGARIVQASEVELGAVCTGATRVNWAVGLGMCALQAALAYPLEWTFGQPIATMLIALSAVHLVYPFGMVHAALAQRFGRFGFLAFLTVLQITGDNLLTAAFAFEGYASWAVVLPRLIVAVVWVAIARGGLRWSGFEPLSASMLRDILRFTRNVLASEMMYTLRNQGDKLLVGKLLGVEAFSTYAFACNAGSGIATTLANTLGTAVLPFLCGHHGATRDVRKRFDLSLIGLTMIVCPIIAAQVALAPWYVPLVFGKQWVPAVPALVVACLATLARPLSIVTQQVLRATGQVAWELDISRWSTMLFFAALAAGLPFGVLGILTTTSIASVVPAVVFAILVRRSLAAPTMPFPASREICA